MVLELVSSLPRNPRPGFAGPEDVLVPDGDHLGVAVEGDFASGPAGAEERGVDDGGAVDESKAAQDEGSRWWIGSRCLAG